MDNLVHMFQQRQTMDTCEITTKLGISSDGQIVDLSITNQNECQMSLSGGTVLTGDGVRMESVGVETTAWIDLNAQGSKHFTFSTPISL